MSAVVFNSLVILTTIQAQDFPDVDGDAAIGRVTLPIYAPELSRLITLLATTMWSIYLSWFWGVGNASAMIMVLTGTYVGYRYYMRRNILSDKRSYVLYNVSTMKLFRFLRATDANTFM